MTATKRSYKDVETNQVFKLFTDSQDNYKLIYEGKGEPMEMANGTEVNGFYICAFTSTTIRLNNKKEIFLPMGTFYNLKEGEIITHKKFIGFKKFSKA